MCVCWARPLNNFAIKQGENRKTVAFGEVPDGTIPEEGERMITSLPLWSTTVHDAREGHLIKGAAGNVWKAELILVQ